MEILKPSVLDDNGFDLFVPYYRIDVYGVDKI